MKLYKILTGILFSTFLLISCDTDLDLLDPNRVTSENYFINGAELQKGVNSIYAALQGGNLVGLEYMWLHELLTDDVSTGGGQLEVDRAAILNGNYGPVNSVINSVFTGWYAVIQRANTVIEKAPLIEEGKITEALRNQSIAEAKFLRAWAYFDLVVLWGEVPIYTEPKKSPTGFQPRAAIADVYQLIISDLTYAIGVLPAVREFDGGRATKYAAQTLLAKVHMHMGDYSSARNLLKEVVNGPFSIQLPYNDNFLVEVSSNDESVFQVNFMDQGGWSPNWDFTGNGTSEESLRSVYVSGQGWRNIIPSNNFLAEFETSEAGFVKNDPRLKWSVYFSGDEFDNGNKVFTNENQGGASSIYNGITIKTSWRKTTVSYRQGSGYHGSAINQRIIRFAEVLIALAECENELGNSSEAIKYLNMVRNRPGIEMPNYPIPGFYPCSNKQEVFQAIMHEKRVELGFEEIRTFDLLRWFRQGKISSLPYLYQPKNTEGYLPIPQSEIDINTEIGQENQTEGF